MSQEHFRGIAAAAGNAIRGTIGLLALLAAPFAMQAQSVTLYGALSNFDVVNDTGGEVHGFEIEFRGSTGAVSYYNWNRYGPPQVIPFAGGVYVRWMSAWNSATQTFVTGTPLAVNPTVLTGHQCIIGTLGYATSGCEHFGLATTGAPSAVIYRWLVADPANPGQLLTYGSTVGVPAPAYVRVAIPAPVWAVQPPAQPALPAVVVANVDPPVPPPPAKLFGDPQWMKTYKTENARQVNLDELVADNPVVPQDEAQIETSWDLMQTKIGDNSRRKQKRGGLGNGSHAVVRRFEFYKYTGAIDPVTGQALCADVLCNAPAAGELGNFIGAQNAAVNLNVPAQYQVTVTVVGDGRVQSADGLIKCPGACSNSVNANGLVTLTATNGKGIFTGWTGACQGVNPTCSFRVNSEATTTATFVLPVRLSVKVTGLGTVTNDPKANDFAPGTAVTMTATPAAGYELLGWGNTCAGTQATCTVIVNAATTVNVTFGLIGAPPPPPPAGPSFKLVVKTNGKGTASSNPSGTAFPPGTVVTITALPDPTAALIGWSGGGCSGLLLTCTVMINADTTVQANFR